MPSATPANDDRRDLEKELDLKTLINRMYEAELASREDLIAQLETEKDALLEENRLLRDFRRIYEADLRFWQSKYHDVLTRLLQYRKQGYLARLFGVTPE